MHYYLDWLSYSSSYFTFEILLFKRKFFVLGWKRKLNTRSLLRKISSRIFFMSSLSYRTWTREILSIAIVRVSNSSVNLIMKAVYRGRRYSKIVSYFYARIMSCKPRYSSVNSSTFQSYIVAKIVCARDIDED
jgi:hypothetical protein